MEFLEKRAKNIILKGGGTSKVHVVFRGGYSKCSRSVHKGEGGVKNSKIAFT